MDAARKRKLNLILAVLLVLTLAFIWGNSLLDREQSAEVSGDLMDLFSELFETLGFNTADDHWLRETAHFGEFAVLGCELCLLFFLNMGSRLQSAANAAFASLAAALMDESLQFMTGRAAEFQDVWLDFVGAGCGILLVWLISRRKQNTK